MTRKATKALINKHHLLEKKRHQALRNGDDTAVATVQSEIAALGGLERYQRASLQGQRNDRGGDSSRVLMDWLRDILRKMEEQQKAGALSGGLVPEADSSCRRLRMLEVGALSTGNACSRSACFDIERIDLNSQGDGILQQDFMERPLPRRESERFDIISLSLVVNFVPDPRARGEMLLRTLEFLLPPSSGQPTPSCFPSLFLVLPSPCVSNSRYLDEPRLQSIMESLGYNLVYSKTTQRLVYYLWKLAGTMRSSRSTFPKRELRAGSSRNNFAIVL